MRKMALREYLPGNAVLVLVALAFGCTAAAPASAPSPAGDDRLSLDGVLDPDPTSRMAAPAALKVVVVWDVAGVDGAAYKLGEGTATPAGFALTLPGPPPAEALVDGAVGVAHLVAIAADATVADGPLSPDDADTLAQTALGASASTTVVYKAKDDAAFDWLAALPKGFSCAQGQAPAPGARMAGDSPQAGFARVACKGVHLALGSLDGMPFTNWTPPAAESAKAVPPAAAMN